MKLVQRYWQIVLGPPHIVLECNTKVPMLVNLLQQGRVECDVNDVLYWG